jgi:hypothetical protein
MYLHSLHGMSVSLGRHAWIDGGVRREMDMERVDHSNTRYHNLLIHFLGCYVGLLPFAFCARVACGNACISATGGLLTAVAP